MTISVGALPPYTLIRVYAFTSVTRQEGSMTASTRLGENERSATHASEEKFQISRRVILGLPLIAAPAWLSGCGAETLLSCSFNQDALNQLPAAQQTVGTVAVAQGNGKVIVAASPAGETDDHWLSIQHPAFNDVTSVQCRFVSFGGEGQYTATARLFIPVTDGGTPTLQFEGFTQPLNDLQSFLHLDFQANGTVRVNDDPALVFGSYQRGQIISVLVTLNITATQATASISLLGAANGTLDITIPTFFLNLARQFGALRVWMGANFRGSFFVDDLSVIRSTP